MGEVSEKFASLVDNVFSYRQQVVTEMVLIPVPGAALMFVRCAWQNAPRATGRVCGNIIIFRNSQLSLKQQSIQRRIEDFRFRIAESF